MTTGVLPSITSPFRQKLSRGSGRRSKGSGNPKRVRRGLCPAVSHCHLSLPEVDGTEPNEHPREHRGLLPQHDGPVIVKPPAGKHAAGCAPPAPQNLSWHPKPTRAHPHTLGAGVAMAGRAGGCCSPGGPSVPQGCGDVLGHSLFHQRHADPGPALRGSAPGSPEDGGSHGVPPTAVPAFPPYGFYESVQA